MFKLCHMSQNEFAVHTFLSFSLSSGDIQPWLAGSSEDSQRLSVAPPRWRTLDEAQTLSSAQQPAERIKQGWNPSGTTKLQNNIYRRTDTVILSGPERRQRSRVWRREPYAEGPARNRRDARIYFNINGKKVGLS